MPITDKWILDMIHEEVHTEDDLKTMKLYIAIMAPSQNISQQAVHEVNQLDMEAVEAIKNS
jgi:hypothetical protein